MSYAGFNGLGKCFPTLSYLCKPGQADPYDWFPYTALGVLVVSIVYAVWLVRRDPRVGERVGSIVADE
jgi:hypothetical protein